MYIHTYLHIYIHTYIHTVHTDVHIHTYNVCMYVRLGQTFKGLHFNNFLSVLLSPGLAIESLQNCFITSTGLAPVTVSTWI